MVSNEVDVGYKVSVSKVMNAKGVANNNGDFSVYDVDPNNVIESNTQYLVTLDVNGVNKLYRELWTSGDADDNNVVPLGDYTYTMDEYSINGLTEDDAVVVRFEEVEVKTSDAFRAAVSKTAPKSEGGSGGGVLIVNVTDGDGGTFVADKSMSEVLSAIASGHPVLCKYNALISFLTKEEDYPEVFTNLSTIGQAINEQGLDCLSVKEYFFEYAEDGTFSGEKSETMISI